MSYRSAGFACRSVRRCISEIGDVTNLFSNIFATVVIVRWMGEIDDDERLNLVIDEDDSR